MSFNEMGLRPELTRALDEIGYKTPTPIQEQAIPRVLEGCDLMCCAQTGTGKTAAFALPILHRIAGLPRSGLRAVVLVPTRELAMQVGKSFSDYGRHLGLVTATVYGGVPLQPQEMVLRHGADVLVATPGRLRDHLWRGNIDFRDTACLVLDEADRMLDMGFIDEVREIISLIPAERQSMLFSATLDREIQRLSRDILRSPVRIEVDPPASTLDTVKQLLVRTSPGSKGAELEGLIRKYRMQRAIIFSKTKSGASRLAGRLRDNGHRASAIHSDRSQSERVRALEGFRSGKIHFLVATDIASRGIDVDDISHVINYDLPRSPEDYVHRIGRTARAGRSGMAISLVTSEDSRGVAAIEKLIGRRLGLDGDSGSGLAVERPVVAKRPSGSARRPAGRRPGSGTREARSSERTDVPGQARPRPRRRSRTHARPTAPERAPVQVRSRAPKPATDPAPRGILMGILGRLGVVRQS